MKGYYIHFNGRDIVGISNKIDSQLSEFAKYHEIQEVDIKLSNKKFLRNALGILPYVSLCWDYTEAYALIKEPDFLYIRKASGDYRHYKFLKYINKQFPSCKVIIEIPTYPYFWEEMRKITGVLLIKDYFNYHFKLKKFIDRIVTFSDATSIFGIPTLRTRNGIDVNSIRPIDMYSKHNSEKINLIAVAFMSPHHGYERVIKGLYQYYLNKGKQDFHIHMVGDGTERTKYEKMIRDYKLETHFTFYGMRKGKELHDIYCKADIALSSFGWYKDKVSKSSTIKVGEYLAKGLPFISGCSGDAFDDTDGEYYAIFPNDSSPIDFDQISSFYDRLYKNQDRRQVIENIREFAKDHIDNSVTMKPIMEYIADSEKLSDQLITKNESD